MMKLHLQIQKEWPRSIQNHLRKYIVQLKVQLRTYRTLTLIIISILLIIVLMSPQRSQTQVCHLKVMKTSGFHWKDTILLLLVSVILNFCLQVLKLKFGCQFHLPTALLSIPIQIIKLHFSYLV